VSDFHAFYAEQYEAVVRSLTMAFQDRAAAEDAAQIGFEKALRRWRTVGALDRPGTWVYVVAVRSGRRALLRDRRDGRDDGTGAGAPRVRGPEPAAVARLALQDALRRLPPRQRTVVVLRHLADLPLRDIAEALGLAVGTVKSTLHTAYERLSVELVDDTPECEGVRHAR
jgi:RNA polymerase sigma-70 factor, ECF subfamily